MAASHTKKFWPFGTRLRSTHCREFNYLKLYRPSYFIRTTQYIYMINRYWRTAGSVLLSAVTVRPALHMLYSLGMPGLRGEATAKDRTGLLQSDTCADSRHISLLYSLSLSRLYLSTYLSNQKSDK